MILLPNSTCKLIGKKKLTGIKIKYKKRNLNLSIKFIDKLRLRFRQVKKHLVKITSN